MEMKQGELIVYRKTKHDETDPTLGINVLHQFRGSAEGGVGGG